MLSDHSVFTLKQALEGVCFSNDSLFHVDSVYINNSAAVKLMDYFVK